MAKAFLQLMRTEFLIRELLKRPAVFVLLTIIALRARRPGSPNPHGLEIGQALIGDFKNYGLTERQYRGAKATAERWGLATFQGTNKGTIATLTDSTVYDLHLDASDGQSDGQATDRVRADDDPTATNEESRIENGDSRSGCGVPSAHDHNHDLRRRFREVVEAWNACHPDRAVDPAKRHEGARVAYAAITDIKRHPSPRAKTGLLHMSVLVAIENLAKAKLVTNSQAGQWGLRGFLERGCKPYMPGYFPDGDVDEHYNAARWPKDRPRRGMGANGNGVAANVG